MKKYLLYGLLVLAMLISVAVAANTSPTTYYQFGPTKFGGPADFDGNPIIDASNITAMEAQSYHLSVIAGGAAGNHTLTGIGTNDNLFSVVYAAKSGSITALTDITSEFRGTGKGIIAPNVIANGGGTNTTGGYIMAFWREN